MSGSEATRCRKVRHRLLRIEHRLVHVDVDDLRAVLDLLFGDGQRGFVVAGQDQLGELGRAGDVGALADVDEVGLRANGQRLQTAQTGARLDLGRHARRQTADRFGDGVDVRGRGAAATADDIEPAVLGPFLELRRERFRRLGETGRQHGVGQPGIRIGADRYVCNPSQLFDERPHLLRAERAVDADAQQLVVRDGVPVCLDRLARKGAPAEIGDGEGDHHRHAAAGLFEILVNGEERGLGVQRIEDRFQQQNVHAAVQQPARLLGIGRDELVEGDGAESRVVDVGGERRRLAGWAEGAGDETNAARLRGHDRVRRGPGVARPGYVQFVSQLLQLVIRQRDGGGVERVASR